MRFGKSAEEAAAEPSRGGQYIRYLKDGETTMRILQEPDEWTYFWEHFVPGGYAFPCTNERDTCPGCTSDIEKMKKASLKVAFNVKQGEYVNVYKVSNTLGDLLKNRAQRLGTITDRDYTFHKFKVGDKVNYDIDGGSKEPIEVPKADFIDIEGLLVAAYNESWGDPNTAKTTEQNARDAAAGKDLKSKIQRAADEEVKARDEAQVEDPPSEPEADAKAEGEEEVSEKALRAMTPFQLYAFLNDHGYAPADIKGETVDEIVDNLMASA